MITTFFTTLVDGFSLKIPEDSFSNGLTYNAMQQLMHSMNNTSFATASSITKGTYSPLFGSSGSANTPTSSKSKTKIDVIKEYLEDMKKKKPKTDFD